MASDKRNEAVEYFPMNSGESFSNEWQVTTKKALDCVKAFMVEGIGEKLDTKPFLSPLQNTFSIADLGCSVGPNTIFAVQNIIDSVKLKFNSDGIDSDSIEFSVFFNDHISNDFNTLFKSIPSDKKYYAAGVPGSFHHRLFPRASLNFVHTSFSLQWLSQVPHEILDKKSPAWNKGKVYYSNSPKEVEEAYKRQFGKDFESFLNARAIEVVSGGLLVFLIPSLPPISKCSAPEVYDLMGSALMDLASMGLVDEEKIDTFNWPIYLPTSNELASLIENSGYFNIERMDAWDQRVPNNDIDTVILHMRAGLEGLIREHFGDEITDKVFDEYKKKIIESSVLADPTFNPTYLFVLLKRKSY